MTAPSYQIAIPSYRRATTLRDKTLATLEAGGVNGDDITVFVGTEAERDEYEAALDGANYGQIVVTGHPGSIAGQRNFIARYWPPGTRILSADDDLKRIARRVDAKTLADIADLPAFFEESFDRAHEERTSIWGIYPVANPYFMKPRVRTDLTYIIASLYGQTVFHEPHELVTLEDKEDFERSIKFYEQDGAVCRFEDVTVLSAYYTEPGGLQETRTPQRVTDSAHELVRRYPHLCQINTGKKSEWTEIKLKDRRTPA